MQTRKTKSFRGFLWARLPALFIAIFVAIFVYYMSFGWAKSRTSERIKILQKVRSFRKNDKKAEKSARI